jgi:hypothetical protein
VGGFSLEIEKIQWNNTFFLHGFNVQVLRGKAYVGGLKESKIQVYQILANASSMTRWSIQFRTQRTISFYFQIYTFDLPFSRHHQSPHLVALIIDKFVVGMIHSAQILYFSSTSKKLVALRSFSLNYFPQPQCKN